MKHFKVSGIKSISFIPYCAFIFFLSLAVCVMDSASACFPISGTCGDGLPELIINQKLILFQDVFNVNLNRDDFNFSVIHDPLKSSICFRNIRTNIRFIEFCSRESNCTSFMLSADDEAIIETKIDIDVRSGKCSDDNIYS